MIRCAVLCVLLALPLTAWCQPASSPRGEVLKLEQAVALAAQNNVNVKHAALTVGQPEDKLTASPICSPLSPDLWLRKLYPMCDPSGDQKQSFSAAC
jgi:hypothetical protein